MQFMRYKDSGRTIMCRFTCRRCGKIADDEMEKVVARSDDHYGHLSFLMPPVGWREVDHSFLLCDDCVVKWREFMKGENDAKG